MSGIAHRGRPKGSGLNDRHHLQAIARLIAANPEFKPTTAIKSLGITDPSAIRRLRDKFLAAKAELMPAVLAAPSQEMSAKTKPTAGTVPPVSDIRLAFRPGELFASWCSMGLVIAGITVEAQLVLAGQILSLPHRSLALGHHLALGELAFALCAPSSYGQQTLH